MLRNRISCVAAVVAAAAGLGVTAPASADISDIVLRIEATNEMGTAFFEGHLSDGTFYPEGHEYIWESRSPIMMLNQAGQVIAAFNNGRVRCVDDPIVQVNFSVSAGSLTTVFTVTSPLLSFASIASAEGRASGGVTATDTDGDGATMMPVGSPGLYTSRYNGFVPGGTLFADLIAGPVTAAAFSSNTANDSSPGGGLFSPIAGAVSDMSARYRFSLTPNDEASGTSTYEIRPIPAPGALALLGLGGLLAARRRRH
jgi:MYXO-CTERM domain-containing protein